MAAFSGDTVCAFQLPLVRDGGAAADLHLHLPQDALPLPPHPPDRVRLHTLYLFFFERKSQLLSKDMVRFRYVGIIMCSLCDARLMPSLFFFQFVL